MQEKNYLNHLRKSKQEITAYLISGIKIDGVITDFDNHTIIIYNDVKHTQNLVYKHAISCISPRNPVKTTREVK